MDFQKIEAEINTNTERGTNVYQDHSYSRTKINDMTEYYRNRPNIITPVPGQYACHFCGKTFKSNAAVVIHTRTHTGERPFDCPHCSSKFRSKSSLILHIRTHTGEKPYSCTYCSKSFTAKSDLYVHQRIHTGDFPHNCTYCFQKFNKKQAKLKHEQKKHGKLDNCTKKLSKKDKKKY